VSPRILALAALAVAALALVATGCSFERRSPDFTCVTSADCTGGRVCSQGFCVDPLAESDAGAADAAPLDDGGAPADTGPDAFVCPPQCSSCALGVCVMDCTPQGSCGTRVVCPAGMPCAVQCGDSACGAGVDCSSATDCRIDCTQPLSCGGHLSCGDGPCRVQCSGVGACTGGIDCDNSCKCDVLCTGTGTCTPAAQCNGPNQCDTGKGCTSSPNPCHSC